MVGSSERRRLAFAATGVLVAAADTYVVVVALPSIMDGLGVGIDHLQRATPIISGYLLGYVAVLPLIGRLSDQVGRRPVLLGCLSAFAAGSLVTATARSLSLLVAGRALAGLGGGGLVPVTLALVADGWPVGRRGLPLGVVSALQELGSVLGPLYGAAVVAVAGWRWIFWLNLPLTAAVAVGYGWTRPRPSMTTHRTLRRDLPGAALLAAALAALVLALAAPPGLADGVTIGVLYASALVAGPWSVLTTPIALVGIGLLVAFVVWEVSAPSSVRALLPLRALPRVLAAVDLPGAALLAGALGCVVVAFSTTDASRQVVASSAPVLGPTAVVLVAALVWRQRRAPAPLLDPAVLRPRRSWGACAASLAIGAALMATLVDVPFFARATIYPDSQLGAAAVLLRFLTAVPIGAVLGGTLVRRPGREALVAAGSMTVAAAALASMATWSASSLSAHFGGLPLGASDVELVAAGLGFGSAIAPINAAVLAAAPAGSQGLATALVVVARTVGMLVGISALTAVALHRFYVTARRIPSPLRICPAGEATCSAYQRMETAAIIRELHTALAGAAVCAGIAAVLALVLLRPPGRR